MHFLLESVEAKSRGERLAPERAYHANTMLSQEPVTTQAAILEIRIPKQIRITKGEMIKRGEHVSEFCPRTFGTPKAFGVDCFR